MTQYVRDLVDDKQSAITAAIINRLLFNRAKRVQALIESLDEQHFSTSTDINLAAAATSSTLSSATRAILSVQRVDGNNRQNFEYRNYRDIVDKLSDEFEYAYSLTGNNILQFIALPEAMTVRVYHTQDIVDVTGDSNEFGFTAGNTTKIFPDQACQLICMGAAMDYVTAESTAYNNIRTNYNETLDDLRRTLKKVEAPRRVRMSYAN